MLGGLIAVPLLLAGCASTPGPAAADKPAEQAPMVAEQGPFLQMCGGVGDEEFRALTGLPADAAAFRNLVGCTWDAQSGGHGSFSWYRGSPIEREYTIVDTTGRVVREVSIAGHDGYEGRTTDGEICEVGVKLGDDFFVWSLVLPPAPGLDNCEVATRLTALTLERAE